MSYTTGAPVDGANFYGRKDLMEEISIFDQRSYFLNGVRRIGKTSILKELKRRNQATNYFTLFIDASADDSNNGLAQSLKRAISNVLDSKKLPFPDAINQASAFEDVLETWIDWCRTSNHQSFLLIDEVETLCSDTVLAPASIRRIIAHLTAGTGVLKVIITGSRQYIVKSKGRNDLADFTALFTTRYVSTLNKKDAFRLMRLENNDEQAQVDVSGQDAESIYAHCGGHPFLLQTICDAHFLRAAKLLKAFDAQLIPHSTLDTFFSTDFNLLDDIQPKVLVQISEQPKTAAELNLKQVNQVWPSPVLELLQLGILVENDKKQLVYQYSLFKDWVFSQKFTQRLHLVCVDADKIHRDKIYNYLAPLVRRKRIVIWDHHEITDGNFKDAIVTELEQAHIIVCLVSAEFLSNNRIWEVEEPLITRLLQEETTPHLIPVLVSHSIHLQLNDIDLFKGRKFLPGSTKSVAEYPNTDEAWMEVVEGIKRILDSV